MDSETQILLLVLAVFAVGAVAGWGVKQDLARARRSPGTAPTPSDALAGHTGAAAMPTQKGAVGFAALGGDCGCKGN